MSFELVLWLLQDVSRICCISYISNYDTNEIYHVRENLERLKVLSHGECLHLNVNGVLSFRIIFIDADFISIKI